MTLLDSAVLPENATAVGVFCAILFALARAVEYLAQSIFKSKRAEVEGTTREQVVAVATQVGDVAFKVERLFSAVISISDKLAGHHSGSRDEHEEHRQALQRVENLVNRIDERGRK